MVVVQDAVGASVAGTSSGEGGALDDLFAEYGSDSDTERMELDGAREQHGSLLGVGSVEQTAVGAGAGDQPSGAHGGGGAPSAQDTPANTHAAEAASPALLRVMQVWPGRSELFCKALCRLIAGDWRVVCKVVAEACEASAISPTHKGLPASFQPCSATDKEIRDIVEYVLDTFFEFQVAWPCLMARVCLRACLAGET